MADLTLTPAWEDGIYRIELTDQVIGGEEGISNRQAKELGNRTEYLKEHVEALEANATSVDAQIAALDGRLDTAETDIDALQLAMRRTLGSASLLKQAIIAAKMGTGSNIANPAFAEYTEPGGTNTLTIVADSTNPLILSFSGGYDADGPINYYARLTSNIVGVWASTAEFIALLDYNSSTGAVTLVLEAWVTPVYSYDEPSSAPNGKYWYDLGREAMFHRESGVWVQRNRIIIGKGIPLDDQFIYLIGNVGKDAKTLYGRGAVPAGVISPFAGASLNMPAGYLLCDGSAISRTTYSDLFQAIGTTYGSGDGSTTFNLPNFAGYFLRGLGGTSAALGVAQAESVNTAGVQLREASTTWAATGAAIGSSQAYFENSNIASYGTNMTLFGGTETRPANYAVNYLIKF
jgi:microcystin-dependent protein